MTDTAQTADQPSRKELICGWIALALSTVIAILWAIWGTIECFHEGWWAATLGGRLLQALAYNSPLLITLALLAVSIRWPKAGAVAYFVLGLLFSWFIFANRWPDLSLETIISWLPVTGMVVGVGFLWWFGRPQPVKLAYWLGIGLPLLVSLGCAIEPVWRISHRVDDGIRTARLVQGNGVSLVWAPAGPGWVRDAKHGSSWDEAVDICAHLSADGTQLLDEPQYIWRLPTIDEAVRSMTRGGENAGGVWNEAAQRASYRTKPDKESPLWDSYAETVYWWTATEIDEKRAWRIVYDGGVWSKPKSSGIGSQGFRAVKEPES